MKAQPKGSRDRVEQGNTPVDDGAKEAGVGRPSSANPRSIPPFKLPTHGPSNRKNLNLIPQLRHVRIPTSTGAEPTKNRGRGGLRAAQPRLALGSGNLCSWSLTHLWLCNTTRRALHESMMGPGHRVLETLLNGFLLFSE